MRLSQENKLRLIGFILIIGIFGNSYDSKPSAVVLGVGTAPAPAAHADSRPAPDLPHFIAHAGGAYLGQTYTNSTAALDQSYANGFRLQEVDLNLTTDHHIILLHDWDTIPQAVFGVAPGQRDLQTFLNDTAGSVHHVAQLQDLAEWVRHHPDTRIILDTKVDTVGLITEVATRYPELRGNFIPFIYQFEQYDDISKLGFPHIALLIRDQYSPAAIAAFARNYPLSFVAMQPSKLQSQLPSLPHYVRIFCWTINDPSIQQQVLNNHAYGIVTDFLSPTGKPSSAPQTSDISM